MTLEPESDARLITDLQHVLQRRVGGWRKTNEEKEEGEEGGEGEAVRKSRLCIYIYIY